MELDFSQCKTKEDVEKVFKEKEGEIKSLKDFEHNLFAQDKLKELKTQKK